MAASLWDGSGEEESDGSGQRRLARRFLGEDLGGKALIFTGVFHVVMGEGLKRILFKNILI